MIGSLRPISFSHIFDAPFTEVATRATPRIFCYRVSMGLFKVLSPASFRVSALLPSAILKRTTREFFWAPKKEG